MPSFRHFWGLIGNMTMYCRTSITFEYVVGVTYTKLRKGKKEVKPKLLSKKA